MADQSNLGNKILITGIVLGLAAGGWGIALSSSNEVAAPDTNVDTGKVNTTLSDAAKKMKADMQADRKVEDTAPKGATINGQPRLAPLFFSTELWQFAADDKKANLVVDIYDPESKSIHGDVPNTWFVTSGIAVQGRDVVPPVSAYTPPATAAEVQGDDLTGGDAAAEGETPAAAAPARTIAVQLTGKPDETARVHMTFQVLYFNPKKK